VVKKRTYLLRNESSRELSFPGAKVPGNFRSQERKFSVGTFAPRSENTEERKVPEPGPLTKKEQHNKQKRRPMTETVHSRYTQTVDRRYSASHLNLFSSSECALLNNSFGALHCLKNKKLSWCWQTHATHLEVSQGHRT